MDTYVKRRMECGERTHLFGQLPELTLTPIETPLFTSLGTVVTNMRSWGVEQVSGNLGFRDGARDRQVTAVTIRGKMRSISAIAKSLELAGVPGITAVAFRMPAQRSYAVLAAAAQAFADNAEPNKAKFIERGLPTTFVEDLEALVTQLTATAADRTNGLFEQTAGSAGLEALADEALKIVQQLRPMLQEHLRENPGLLGAWNLASRVASSRDTESATTPEDPGSGTTPPAGS